MLIIPLHQPLTLARFPWVTAALILINVLVYFGLQARDQRAYTSAAEFYQRTGLIELELPWLQRHLRSQGRDDLAGMLDALGEPMRSRAAVEIQAMDSEFAERIRGAPFFEEGDERLPQWRANRAEFEAQLSLAFTPRHALLFHDPTPWRHFSSMFLHGDVMHLIGNMVFLALLGLMTEAALGPWLFLGVYVIGGFGAGLVSVLRHFGEFGSLLGASGAIAALMGACCVVWGMRKVRVFYWFFVIFDYIKVPALLLLPVWLGWELWQMWSTPDSRVAFDAHAGGIITGALATFAIRKLGWERREAMDQGSTATEELPDLYRATRSALGKLEFAAARELSERLVRQHPNEREAWRLRMRAWRDRAQESAFHEA
ncbi:MAG: rhomboid family intramembrane serine protease, partial [Rhodanobacteraceae bacterium]|nr:rhomboid family intramembrane serine protease [Rhodanobacteraceae bacterium]